MKEMLLLMADYNIQTNGKLLKILKNLPGEDLNKELGSNFGSIFGIANHMLGSTIKWLTAYPEFFPEIGGLVKDIPKVPDHAHGELAWDSLAEFEPYLMQVDQIFKTVVETIPESRLSEKIHMVHPSGKTFDKYGWHILLHLFNHITHHRGAISTMLDQLQVKNDYSNLLYTEF